MARPAEAPAHFPIQWAPATLVRERSGRSVKLSTYTLMPTLRMSGAMPLLPLYVSVALKGTVSPCAFLSDILNEGLKSNKMGPRLFGMVFHVSYLTMLSFDTIICRR
jgi:hypothetical protein